MSSSASVDSFTMDNEPQGQPPTKKLRSSHPDLEIHVKCTDEDGKMEQKEYQFYAPVLATMSNFIDTALSVEMKEKATRLITFKDVSPEVFELALKFQTDPTTVLSMTPQDAIRVVEFYHKYDFTGGLELCDCILDRYIQKNLEIPPSEPLEDIDLLVDAVALAERCHLSKSTDSGKKCMEKRLQNNSERFYAVHFSEDHIRKLHPMFVTGALNFTNPATEQSLSQEELESPLFPKYFVESVSHWARQNKTVCLTVNGGTAADGQYSLTHSWRYKKHAERLGGWNGRRTVEFMVEKLEGGDWSISIYDHDASTTVVLWKSPHSQNFFIPPKGPWIAVDEHAKGIREPSITVKRITFF